MSGKPIDLGELTGQQDRQIDEIVSRLEGSAEAESSALWGDEFAASGNGPKSPPPPVCAIVYE